MFFRKIESPGVSHYSYFIADGDGAVVIDPRRDVDVYLELAREGEYRIRYILETHRNEDYVIGSTALARATGAEILHSKRQDFGYGRPVGDGDEVGVGDLRIRVLETPGHSEDSLTFVLADTGTSEDAVCAFTGDALFIGDTGRTDLYGEGRFTEAAEKLYHSIFDKILPLGDGVVLCPAHGGGSVCGGDISDRDVSTLGYERLHNPKLASANKEEFVRMKLEEKHIQPPYFRRMEEWNLRGNAPIYDRLPTPTPLSPSEMATAVDTGAVVVDTRTPRAFAGGHIPGSYNVWLDGVSAYLGHVIEPGTSIALVLPEHASVEEVTRLLLRIGYDELAGYLRGGFDAWQNEGREVAQIGTLDTAEIRSRMERGEDLAIVDVRKPDEWESGTIEGAHEIFVGDLERRLDELPRDRPLVSMCSVGHRGGIGASILARHGFPVVYNYLGGYKAWQLSG